MPDADGNVKGIAVPAEAWERIFGKRQCDGTCDRPESGSIPCWEAAPDLYEEPDEQE